MEKTAEWMIAYSFDDFNFKLSHRKKSQKKK